MVEGGHQLDVLGEQHPVTEHVAGHVADADHGEVLGLGVDPHVPEVPLHRLPGAPGGDAHLLVVVAGGAAGGERVGQPEAVRHRDLVGDVGEGGGALVRRDHQVRVVAVVPDHLARRHDLPTDQVVGHVEQGGDELLVADHRLVPVARLLLEHEAALGADRHDHRVLHHLRLDQAEHLGTEVLPPVRPAQPAPGHRPEPQVYALEPGRVDEDLVLRPGCRQLRDRLRVQLERHVRLRPAVGTALVEAGPQGGLDQRQVRAQDPVLVEAGHLVQRLADALHQLACSARPAGRRRAATTARTGPRRAAPAGGRSPGRR